MRTLTCFVIRPPRVLSYLRGSSMIEVLITLTIVAVSMLGLLGLQVRTMSYQKDSFNRKAAAELAYQMGERMKANPGGYMAGSYSASLTATGTLPTVGACAGAACTATEVATRDLTQWQSEVRRRLPAAAVFVVPESGATPPSWVDIVVAWPEPNQVGANASGADALCVELIAANYVIPTTGYRCYRISVFP